MPHYNGKSRVLSPTMASPAPDPLTPAPDAPGYQVDDLTIEPGSRQVRRAGTVIPLPALSFDLLVALARAAPNVLTFEQLGERVWPGVVATPETISQRVKLVRDALGDDPHAPRYVEAVRGRGYRMVAKVRQLAEQHAPPDSNSIPALKDKSWSKPVVGAVAVVLVALALTYFAVNKLWSSKRPASSAASASAGLSSPSPSVREKSIAVLPFGDLSEKHDQEYFGDGMAEEILDILAKVPQLTVIGRTSSFQFKGRAEDLRTIGGKLGAAYIVEGSVRRAGARIRVAAQLIDAQSGVDVWSDSYDRDYGDILTLQDEIATAIARALQLTIGAHNTRPLASAQSREAYTLYLKGKLALDKFEGKSLLEAQNSFQQALGLDPTLLAAAEALAETYRQRGALESDISSREAWGEAKAAAEAALRMNSRSAIAYGVLGFVAGQRDFEWTKAESEFRRALALNPNDPDTLANAAQISGMHGDFEEALHRFNASLTLDPLNAVTNQSLGGTHYCRGDYSRAEAAYRKSITFDPQIVGSHYHIGLMYLAEGRPNEALKEFEADPEISIRDVGISLVSHALGRKPESDVALARLINESGKFWPYGVALVHAYRGERDLAFDWLDKAYAASDIDLVFVLCDPYLVTLHDDPRWLALMKKMNLSK